MMISNEILEIIELVGLKKLPETELTKFDIKEYNIHDLDELLQSYLENNDWKNFRIIFWYLPTTLNDDEKEILTRKYILDYTHFEHEEMILGFTRRYFNRENIPVITKLINNPPKYFFDVEREYVFIDKCFIALKAQGGAEGLQAIKNISVTTQDDIKRKMAMYLIKNWNSDMKNV